MTVRIPKDQRAHHRRLLAAGAVWRVNGGGHRQYTLPNGRVVVMSSSPSDWRTLRHIEAEVRRALEAS